MWGRWRAIMRSKAHVLVHQLTPIIKIWLKKNEQPWGWEVDRLVSNRDSVVKLHPNKGHRSQPTNKRLQTSINQTQSSYKSYNMSFYSHPLLRRRQHTGNDSHLSCDTLVPVIRTSRQSLDSQMSWLGWWMMRCSFLKMRGFDSATCDVENNLHADASPNWDGSVVGDIGKQKQHFLSLVWPFASRRSSSYYYRLVMSKRRTPACSFIEKPDGPENY